MKLPDKIHSALEESGLPWVIEEGRKHYHIRLNGRLIGILPKGKGPQESSSRDILNTVSQIRRASKGPT